MNLMKGLLVIIANDNINPHVRFLQAFKTRRCANQAVKTKLILPIPMIMPYFIKSKLFSVSAWESLHLGRTSGHFQRNKLQVSEYLIDGCDGF